ncbi:MAG: hypothetical protein WDZ30_01655 [Cellvibrionaceae bacterium]
MSNTADKLSTAISKYCAHHAESEIEQLNGFPNTTPFHQVVVIPAYNENFDFIARLRQLALPNPTTLAIVVINQPHNETDGHLSETLFASAQRSGSVVWQNAQLTLLAWQQDSYLLLVNRYSEKVRIPRKQGVGLARKIGCDLALALQAKHLIATNLIHTTDADAVLPADYFQQTRDLNEISAAIYPFRHRCDDDALGRATRLYENSLHYYVRGLGWAGSPYAFHTIGSCLAISIYHYALARGFPKRAGGEDFYLLNKLAKLAPVANTRGAALELQARHSCRTPFGTGPAVEKILNLESPDDFPSYDPRVFAGLRTLLQHLDDLWQYRLNHTKWLNSLPASLENACTALGIDQLLRHLANHSDSEAQYRRHTHSWFDAFRTLKFVHYLQNHSYPAIPFTQALAEADLLFADF